jgi:hypothetical protein
MGDEREDDLPTVLVPHPQDEPFIGAGLDQGLEGDEALSDVQEPEACGPSLHLQGAPFQRRIEAQIGCDVDRHPDLGHRCARSVGNEDLPLLFLADRALGLCRCPCSHQEQQER